MLAVVDNDSIRRFLCMWCRDGVPSVERRRRLRISSIATLLVRDARRLDGELIKDLLLPTPLRT